MDHHRSSTKDAHRDSVGREPGSGHERRRRLRSERLRLWRKELRRRRLDLDDAGSPGRFAS